MKVINKNIDMIVIFDPEWNITPYRFKIEEHGEVKAINVDKLVNRIIQMVEGQTYILFKCQSIINDIEKVYEITFNKNKLVWKLYKA